MSTDENKSLIQAGFDAWAKGEGDFYSLLADDAKWTITGSSPVAGTFSSRQEFLDRAVQPIYQRRSQPLRPTVKTLLPKVTR
jgi:ketosteroid isomerase-like protein